MSQPQTPISARPARSLLVIAILRTTCLEAVERALQRVGIDAITVTRAKGYGEHANLFSWDPHVPVVRLEIFTSEDLAAQVARVIAEAAHTGEAGDGIVALVPTEKLIRIRDAPAST